MAVSPPLGNVTLVFEVDRDYQNNAVQPAVEHPRPTGLPLCTDAWPEPGG
jgi:hypothetical protein